MNDLTLGNDNLSSDESADSTAFSDLGQSYCLAFENLLVALERAKEKCSVKRVHRLRRACRRLQSACALGNELLANKCGQGVNQQVRSLLSATGELRDLQVNRQLLESWLAVSTEQPTEEAEAQDNFPKLTRREKKLRQVVRAKLRNFDTRPLVDEFTYLLGKLHWKYGNAANRTHLLEELRSALSAVFSRVLDRSQGAEQASGKQIHRLRIAFKRYRYSAELAQQYFPTLARRAEQFDRWQDALGEVQDLRVVKKMLKESVPCKEQRSSFKMRIKQAEGEAMEKARAVVMQFSAISPQNGSDDTRYLS